MPDLGIDVLFKGTNMLRLLQGLWVAMKISIVSILISMPLGILVGALMTVKNKVVKAFFSCLSGIHPHHAAAGIIVHRIFRFHQSTGMELIR